MYSPSVNKQKDSHSHETEERKLIQETAAWMVMGQLSQSRLAQEPNFHYSQQGSI
jgi:hypothetical protein